MTGEPTPAFGKGKKYRVEIAAVAWLDLLGYGGMLEAVKFDAGCAAAAAAVTRLENFHEAVAAVAHRNFRVSQLNDAAVFFKDLSPRAESVTFDFLARSYDAYRRIGEVDAAGGYPGARMVVAAGPRLRLRTGRKHGAGHLQNLERRSADGFLSQIQALREAFRSGPIAGFVPELQANFAFTKAYLVDSGGARAGFPGAHCYVDLALFDDSTPTWSHLGPPIEWSALWNGRFLRQTQRAG